MKLPILILSTISLIYAAPVNITENGNVPTFGSYSFSYATQGASRSEVRQLDGTVRGAYNYLDDEGLFHDIKYIAGQDNGFEIVEHNLKGSDGQITQLPNADASAVQRAKTAHQSYQSELKSILPAFVENDETEEDIPVFARRIPSPVKDAPNFPDVNITPLLQSRHQQVQTRPQNIEIGTEERQITHIRRAPTVESVAIQQINHETRHPVQNIRQLSNEEHRRLRNQNRRIPATSDKNIHAETFNGHSVQTNQQNFEAQRTLATHSQRTPPAQIVHQQINPETVHDHSIPSNQQHFNTESERQLGPHHIRTTPTVKNVDREIQVQTAHSRNSETRNFEKEAEQRLREHFRETTGAEDKNIKIRTKTRQEIVQGTSAVYEGDEQKLLAYEVKLVNGLTPEVAAARAQHLAAVAAVRAKLPELELEEE